MSPPLIMTGIQPASAPAPACVPVAHLSVATVWIDGDELEIAAIRLGFDYDGATVRAGTRATATPRLRRDGAAEVGARRLLEGLGAIDLSCLDDCDTGGAVDYAVRLDRDVHALCGFTLAIGPDHAGALALVVTVTADADGGAGAGCCSTGGGGRATWLLPALAAMLGLRRRRRRGC